MENVQQKIMQKIATGDYTVLIKDACEHNGTYSEAYPIGFEIFDKVMVPVEKLGKENGGIRDGDLVVITGISGHGKTTFAQNIVMKLNAIAIPVAFFSYEVIIDHIYAKFKAMGFVDDGVIYAPKKIISGNIRWIAEKIKEAKDKYFIKVFVIDHIDFLTPTNSQSSDQQRTRLKNICKELKDIARNEKVIIILMAHVKKVQGREVEMQDIAESSGIYQEADFVFSIQRFSQIDTINGKSVTRFSNEGIIKMLKNRLCGELPVMIFRMNNNNIIPLEYENSSNL